MSELIQNGSDTLQKPAGGGLQEEWGTWTQQLGDVTITKKVPMEESSSNKVKVECVIKSNSIQVIFDNSVVLDKQLSYEIDAMSSNWSVEGDEVLIDLCKKVDGYWEKVFIDSTSIDIKTLGPKVGDVGKKADPNEPVKIDDPDMIAKVVKEHPELASGLAITNKSGGESLVTTKCTTSTFSGNSSFSW
jgi:hypothetical protein